MLTNSNVNESRISPVFCETSNFGFNFEILNLKKLQTLKIKRGKLWKDSA